MIHTRYLDLECVALRNASIELLVTESVGPRIIRLSWRGQENILAELPGVTLDCPGAEEPFYTYGGHRLWHAPQVPARTHLPDNKPVTIESIPGGVAVTQATEPQTGIQKSLRITLPDDSPTVIVDHFLSNHGMWPLETAPWAITQFRKGGVAIIPQTEQWIDAEGVWPNRNIALWPFTSINDPAIRWGDRFIFVHANMKEGMLKFGFPNPEGWLAYHVKDTLFVKRAAFDPQAAYFDRGSSSHVFCSSFFLELETLGPRAVLDPGAVISHRETWTLYPDIEFNPTEEEAAALAQRLAL